MEEGYKIWNRVCQKEKYNIAQNESFVQIGVGIKSRFSYIGPISILYVYIDNIVYVSFI